jgi:phage replication-related protein YjqB (UPF0714/DUF867 family)
MPYTKKKAELPEGFIDLGEEVPAIGMTEIEIEAPKSEYHYPSLYFDNAKELSKLPEEGTAVIHFKKVMEKKEVVMRDGEEKKRHCVELQICGIKSDSVTDSEEYDDDDEIENGLKEAEEED